MKIMFLKTKVYTDLRSKLRNNPYKSCVTGQTKKPWKQSVPRLFHGRGDKYPFTKRWALFHTRIALCGKNCLVGSRRYRKAHGVLPTCPPAAGKFVCSPHTTTKKRHPKWVPFLCGRGDKIRTCDFYVPNKYAIVF